MELEQRVGDVAGGEGLGGDLDGGVLAGRVEEEDGVAELDGDGLGPADVDVRLGGGRRPPRVQPANLVRRRRGAAGHGHGHEEEQQRRKKQKRRRHAHPLLCFSAQAPDAQHQRSFTSKQNVSPSKNTICNVHDAYQTESILID